MRMRLAEVLIIPSEFGIRAGASLDVSGMDPFGGGRGREQRVA